MIIFCYSKSTKCYGDTALQIVQMQLRHSVTVSLRQEGK